MWQRNIFIIYELSVDTHYMSIYEYPLIEEAHDLNRGDILGHACKS